MGEPAIPPPAERKTTHELARQIVAAVRNDEPMPMGLEGLLDRDAEAMSFMFAQEIVLLIVEVGQLESMTTNGGLLSSELLAERDAAIRERDLLKAKVRQLNGCACEYNVDYIHDDDCPRWGLTQQLRAMTAARDHALAVLDETLDICRARALWAGEGKKLRKRARELP